MAVKRTSKQKVLNPKKKAPKSIARSNKEGIAASAYDIAKAGQNSNPLSIIRMIGGRRVPISSGSAKGGGTTRTTSTRRRTRTIKTQARSYRGR